MNSRERIMAVLAGEKPDMTPIFPKIAFANVLACEGMTVREYMRQIRSAWLQPASAPIGNSDGTASPFTQIFPVREKRWGPSMNSRKTHRES